MTIDLYVSHLHRHLLCVSLPTGVLMRFVNLLYKQREYLHVKPAPRKGDPPRDVVVSSLLQMHKIVVSGLDKHKDWRMYSDEEKQQRALEIWPEDKVLISEFQETVHNFTIDPRWMLEYKLPTFCPDSLVPIPWCLSKDEPEDGEIVYLRQYEPILCVTEYDPGGRREDTAAPRDIVPAPAKYDESPFRRLERLLAQKKKDEDKPLLGPILKDNFMAVKYEFDDMQKSFMQQQVPDFEATRIVDQGKRDLDLLRTNGFDPSDFEVFVSEGLQARENYYKYLKRVKDGKELIKKQLEDAESRHTKTLDMLENALKHSQDVKIPGRFEQEAQKFNVNLKFPALAKTKKKRMGGTPEPDLEEGGFSIGGFPEATYPLSYLRAKRVVCRVNAPVDEGSPEQTALFRQMSLTFRATAHGDWDVEIVQKERLQTRSILEFAITKMDIERMRGAGKTARLPFGNDFVVLQAFNLLQLLTLIRCGVS